MRRREREYGGYGSDIVREGKEVGNFDIWLGDKYFSCKGLEFIHGSMKN